MIEWYCEFYSPEGGFYLTPLIAFAWEDNKLGFHLGWLFWRLSVERREVF